jgi:hypothetical protein
MKRKRMDITGEAWKYAIRDIKGAMKGKGTEDSEQEESPKVIIRSKDKGASNELRMHLM